MLYETAPAGAVPVEEICVHALVLDAALPAVVLEMKVPEELYQLIRTCIVREVAADRTHIDPYAG
jgi:hypothetical protein